MMQVTLSDHTAEQARSAAAKRQEEFDQANSSYAEAMGALQAKSETLRENSRRAWRDRRYSAWFLSWFPRIAHALSSSPRPPVMDKAGRDEIVWNAGGEGERRVTDALARRLPDDWILIDGYKNTAGEIDKVLIGPMGVLAIEIKFVNGKVHCDGDRWWRDKYDKYGNLVEKAIPIADRRGRGPSAQVNAAADRLQSFLSKRSPVQRVNRAVVLSHESSAIGNITNSTIDLIATLQQLDVSTIAAVMRPGSGGLNACLIADLIQKDHAFHERPRESEKINRNNRK